MKLRSRDEIILPYCTGHLTFLSGSLEKIRRIFCKLSHGFYSIEFLKHYRIVNQKCQSYCTCPSTLISFFYILLVVKGALIAVCIMFGGDFGYELGEFPCPKWTKGQFKFVNLSDPYSTKLSSKTTYDLLSTSSF